MQKLELYFNAFLLGELNFDGKEYTFTLDENSTKLLLKNGVHLALFQVGKKEQKSKALPLVFEQFLPKETEKQNLLASVGITKNLSDFEKLIRISKLSLKKEQFWLKHKES